MTEDDARRISRRDLLSGIATTGTAAAIGGGTAAVVRDDERAGLSLATGTLDLVTAWSDGGDVTDLGTVSQPGESGSDRLSVGLADGDNPAYVWVRTACKQCTELERKLSVTIELVTGAGRTTLFDGGTLAEARDKLGDGVRLDGVLTPGDEWKIDVQWELEAALTKDDEVELTFDAWAVQARNADDPAAFAPDWSCEERDCPDDPDPKDISWVAFCAVSGETIEPADVTFGIQGPYLQLHDAPASLGTLVLKYGTQISVFHDPDEGVYVTGTGTTYDQVGPEFPGSGRSNAEPCPGTHGFKHEVSE